MDACLDFAGALAESEAGAVRNISPPYFFCMKNCHDGLLRTASVSSWRRRACCSLLGNQLISQCLHIGDVLLVSVRINPNVWSLGVCLHLLVLAGAVEERTVRTEENIGALAFPFSDGC